MAIIKPNGTTFVSPPLTNGDSVPIRIMNSCHQGRFWGRLVLLLCGVTIRCWAGGGPTDILLVYTPSDSNSQAIADYYASVWQVPATNKLPVEWNITPASAFAKNMGYSGGGLDVINFGINHPSDEITTLIKNPIDTAIAQLKTRGITIRQVLLCGSLPFKMFDSASPTKAQLTVDSYLALGKINDTFQTNLYYMNHFGNAFDPADSNTYRYLVGHLYDPSLAVMKAIVDNGHKGDASRPAGTVYFQNNPADKHRNIRYPDTAFTAEELKAAGISVHRSDPSVADGFFPQGVHDIIGVMTGGAHTNSTIGTNPGTFLPGALFDNMTSQGGSINVTSNGFHFMDDQFTEMGAIATSGDCNEPGGVFFRFNSPRMYMAYINGLSAGEVEGSSVYDVIYIVNNEDPLSSPFAVRPTITLSLADGGVINGATDINLTAATTRNSIGQAAGIKWVKLYIDDTLYQTLNAPGFNPGETIHVTLGSKTVSYAIPTNATTPIVVNGLINAINASGAILKANLNGDTFSTYSFDEWTGDTAFENSIQLMGPAGVPYSAVGTPSAQVTTVGKTSYGSLQGRGRIWIAPGSPSFSTTIRLDPSKVSDGVHNLRVVAYDSSIQEIQGWKLLSFTMNNGGGVVPPTVSITAPTAGAVFTAGSDITLTASASASGSATISEVDFYQGSTFIGKATSGPPYTLIWPAVPADSYSLTAKATDSSGQVGTTVSAVNITVNNPVPSIDTSGGLNPSSVVAGGTANVPLTINGSNFIPGATGVAGSVVAWNGNNHNPTSITSTQIRVSIPASDVSTSGSLYVTVVNPSPGGGTSNVETLTITPNANAPSITDLSQTSAMVGDIVSITITGTHFISGDSEVQWNGTTIPSTVGSATKITVSIPTLNAGVFTLSVLNALESLLSNAMTFTVNNPVPTVTSLTPSLANAGDTGQPMMVNGTNFVPSSVVNYNGDTTHITQYISSTQLSITLTDSDLASPGTIPVTVTNPAPGGGTSTPPVTFTINSGVPVLNNLSPSSQVTGLDLSLTVNGAHFQPGDHIQWNGTNQASTYVSGSQLTTFIPASQLQVPGSYAVTVLHPDGKVSTNSLIFTLTNPPASLISLSPNAATVGDPSISVTLTGKGLLTITQVLLNGSVLASFTPPNPSDTQLTVTIPASDLTTSTSLGITVNNPAGLSNALSFIVAQAPVISFGSSAFTASLNDNIVLQTDNGVSNLTWTFTSTDTGQATISDKGIARAPGGNSVIARTSGPKLSLSSVSGLGVGTYTLTVIGSNPAGKTATATANVTLISGSLDNVRVYPNPWRTNKSAAFPITFDQLSTNSIVKIFTVSGHFMKSLDASSGIAKWDLTNDAGDKVASGLYIYLITNDQGQKTTGKLAVIR